MRKPRMTPPLSLSLYGPIAIGVGVYQFMFELNRKPAIVIPYLFALLFIFAGIYSIWILWSPIFQGWRLRRIGEPVTAHVTKVQWLNGENLRNRRFRQDNLGDYRLICEYQENGHSLQFVSGPLWKDYYPFEGLPITVYRNPKRYMDYYVDVKSALSQSAVGPEL